jgi:hypothetical protein
VTRGDLNWCIWICPSSDVLWSFVSFHWHTPRARIVVGIALFPLFVTILVARILNEEKVLARGLPDYVEYGQGPIPIDPRCLVKVAPGSVRKRRGSCHCGATLFTVAKRPDTVTRCTCSFCTKCGALWAYQDEEDDFVLITARDRVSTYQWGSYRVEHHHCAIYGCADAVHGPVHRSGTARRSNRCRESSRCK